MTLTPSLKMIALDHLHESQYNPRRHISAEAIQELAKNIKAVGVLTPLLVRPNENGYEIGGGHRRYRAATLAGLSEVPCIVRTLTDTEFLEIMTLDNLHREDVHPLDEAEGYRALMDQAHYDVSTIAAKVGKSESYIYQRLKLADLIENAKEAFLNDSITAGHAILLARLDPEQQQSLLEDCTNNYDPLSVRALSLEIRRSLYLTLSEAPFPTDDAALLPEAGSCIECPKRTGFNRGLFPDIEEADTCTDKACHASKVAAWLVAKFAQASRNNKGAIRISVGYGTIPPGARKNWTAAGKKKCPDTVPGLVVAEGYRDVRYYKLGQVVQVCTNKKCAVHHASGPTEKNATARRTSKEYAERMAANDIAYRAMVDGIRARIDEPVPDAAWRLIGKTALSELYGDAEKRILTSLMLLDADEVSPHLNALTGAQLECAVLIIIGGTLFLGYGAQDWTPTEQAFLDAFATPVQTRAKKADKKKTTKRKET